METQPCLKEKISSVQTRLGVFSSQNDAGGKRGMQHLGSIPTSGIQNFGEHPHTGMQHLRKQP